MSSSDITGAVAPAREERTMAENETPSTEQTAGDKAAEAKPVLNRKLLSETIDILKEHVPGVTRVQPAVL